MAEAVPGADEIDQHDAAFIYGNEDVVGGVPRPAGILESDVAAGSDDDVFRGDAEIVAHDPKREARIAAVVVFHQQGEAAEDPVGIWAEVEKTETAGDRGERNESHQRLLPHQEPVQGTVRRQRPPGAVEIGTHLGLIGAPAGTGGTAVIGQREGKTVIDPARCPGGVDQGLVVLGIEPGSKNEVVRLGRHAHGGKITHRLGEVGSTEVVIVQLLDGGVVQIHMDDGVVVWQPQMRNALPQAEKMVKHLPIPGCIYSGQKQHPQVRYCQRAGHQQQDDPRLALHATGVQW